MDQRSRSPALRPFQFPFPTPPGNLPPAPLVPGPLFPRPGLFSPLAIRPMVAPPAMQQVYQQDGQTAEAHVQQPPRPPAPPQAPDYSHKSDPSLQEKDARFLLENMANKQLERINRVAPDWNPSTKFFDTTVRWGMPLHRAVDVTPWSLANGTAGIKWEDIRLGAFIPEKDSIPLKSYAARNVLAGIAFQS